MNNRDLLLVGAGALVGYLLLDKMNKNKASLRVGTTSLPDTSSQTVPPSTTVETTGGETLVDPRVAICEDNWSKYSSTMRFGSEEQARATHDNFITSCLAKS
jgi:hypothetical protein